MAFRRAMVRRRMGGRCGWAAAAAGCVAATSVLLAPGTAAAPVPDRLEVSFAADRSAAEGLDGAHIVSAAAVFVESIAHTSSVSFYLDGSATPVRVESTAPFDLAGTGDGQSARLFPVQDWTRGLHRLTAVRAFDDGRPAVSIGATFWVDPMTPATHVVRTCGTGLCMDGLPWRVNGGSTNGNPDNGQTPAGNIALALDLGVNTLRLTDFIPEPGLLGVAEYSESVWAGVDNMIALAGRNGLKVELDLSTYRNFLQVQSPTFDPYTYDWTRFLTFVANRRNTVTGRRYGSDSTIAFVSFAGETEAPDHSYSTTRGITGQQLVSFYDRVMTLWRRLAPGQLRIPGGLYFLTDPTMPWQQIFALASCDVPAMHSYSTDDEQSQPWVQQVAGRLGKPWMLEEFGFSTQNYPADPARSFAFTRQYDLALSNRAAGVAWWNIDPAAIAAPSYPLTVAAVRAMNTGIAMLRSAPVR